MHAHQIKSLLKRFSKISFSFFLLFLFAQALLARSKERTFTYHTTMLEFYSAYHHHYYYTLRAFPLMHLGTPHWHLKTLWDESLCVGVCYENIKSLKCGMLYSIIYASRVKPCIMQTFHFQISFINMYTHVFSLWVCTEHNKRNFVLSLIPRMSINHHHHNNRIIMWWWKLQNKH